jgi:hypothetical protein
MREAVDRMSDRRDRLQIEPACKTGQTLTAQFVSDRDAEIELQVYPDGACGLSTDQAEVLAMHLIMLVEQIRMRNNLEEMIAEREAEE